jgi:hypothetical protein
VRDKRPDAEIAIAFPRFKTYENLVQRTMVSFGLLGFGVYFVNDNGSVDLVLPHRPVGDEVAEPAAMTALPEVGEARGAAVGREATCRAEILDAFDRLERRRRSGRVRSGRDHPGGNRRHRSLPGAHHPHRDRLSHVCGGTRPPRCFL